MVSAQHKTSLATRSKSQSSWLQLSFWALVSAVLFSLAGCSVTNGVPEMEYGKNIGDSGGKSINGTGVFAQLLREKGHTVRRQTKISPRLNRYDTVIWFPERYDHPKADAVIWLENWLADGEPRTLIFVGRDYQCDLDYWNDVVGSTSGKLQEKARRERAEALSQKNSNTWWTSLTDDDQVDFWYESESHFEPHSETLSGKWASNVDDNETSVSTRVVLSPATTLNDEQFQDEHEFPRWGFRDHRLKTKTLLKADGKPFAFQIESDDVDGRIVVISNASFLLNYAILKKENRQLAMNVANECEGDIVFLETTAFGASVSDSENEPHSTWAWIAQEPMNYIVPHLLLWGVLFCFVYFPIFGRPKRVNFSPEKKFQNHVTAVGEMLRRTKDKTWAEEKIADFQKKMGRKKK